MRMNIVLKRAGVIAIAGSLLFSTGISASDVFFSGEMGMETAPVGDSGDLFFSSEDVFDQVSAYEESAGTYEDVQVQPEEMFEVLSPQDSFAAAENDMDLFSSSAETAVFQEAYYFVKQNTIAYYDAQGVEEVGIFSDNCAVYAVETVLHSETGVEWLKVVFDTTTARQAGTDLREAWIRKEDSTPLSEFEMVGLLNSLEEDGAVRFYKEQKVPMAPFLQKMDPADLPISDGFSSAFEEVIDDQQQDDEIIFDEFELAGTEETENVFREGQAEETAVTDLGDIPETEDLDLTALSLEEEEQDIEELFSDEESFIEGETEATTETGFEIVSEAQIEEATEAVFGSEVVAQIEDIAETEFMPVAETEAADLVEETTEVTTEEADLFASSAVSISKQPENVTAAAGSTARFTVTASGTSLTYQWQTKTSPTAGWANTGLGGNKTAILSFSVKQEYDGRQFRCVITDSTGNKVRTDAATLTVSGMASEGPSITTQPADVTVASNGTATFSVVAVGTDLTYQWQTKTSETSGWGNTGLSGSKTAELSFKALSSYDGRQFRCIIKDADGAKVTSQAAALSVTGAPKISMQPEAVSVGTDGTAVFTIIASGTGTVSYQWQTKTSPTAGWTNTGLNGCKTAKLNFKAQASYDGRQFRCKVTDEEGETISKAVSLTVTDGPAITTHPDDVTVYPNATATFHVVATGSGELSYQWETKPSATAGWANTDLDGSGTATLSFPAQESFNGHMFRCKVTDADGNTSISGLAVLTVSTDIGLSIIKDPEDLTVDANGTAAFTVEAGGADLSYQWQTKASATVGWTNTGLGGNKTATLSFTAPANYDGRKFRCKITDGNGTTVTSKEAILTVLGGLEITKQPEDWEGEENATASFNVEATGTEPLTYQWQTKTSPTAGWTNTGLNGNKTETLSFPVKALYDGRKYRCKITDANGKQVTSGAANLKLVSSEIMIDLVVYEPFDETTCFVKEYRGNAATLTIPETVQNMTVTEIGESAFENNSTLESIDLPDTITVIGKKAFKNCSNLKSMN